MRPYFSEFTYGFALTHELISISNILQGAPVFPSLYNEGQSGGYDVGLGFYGYPLFLQFKLSEIMLRPSASEWGTYNKNYYRDVAYATTLFSTTSTIAGLGAER